MVAEIIAVEDANGRKAPWLKEAIVDTTSVREGVNMLPLHRMRIRKQQLFWVSGHIMGGGEIATTSIFGT